MCEEMTHQYCRKLVAITSSSSKSSSLGGTALMLPLEEWERLKRGAGLLGRAWAGSGLFEWVDGRLEWWWWVAIEMVDGLVRFKASRNRVEHGAQVAGQGRPGR